MRFRPLVQPAVALVGGLLVLRSVLHVHTAALGLLQEVTHRSVHLAFVLGLILRVFPHRQALLTQPLRPGRAAPGGVLWFDWGPAAAVAALVLYIPWVFGDLAFRIGNSSTLDVLVGMVLIASSLEATRRCTGWPLQIIVISFMAYALA